jgi:hypothetical protein
MSRFLRQKGYTVVDWDRKVENIDEGTGSDLDPRISKFLSSSTMCFFPYLFIPPLVQAIVIAKPNLYLGLDLVGYTVSPDDWLVSSSSTL